LIAGGRNIADSYFEVNKKNLKWRFIDRDYYVQGNAAQDARAYFMSVWESKHVVVPDTRRITEEQVTQAKEKIDRYDRISERLKTTRLSSELPWSSPLRNIEDIKFISDPVNEKGKVPGVERKLLEIINGAKETLIIETPYLVLTPEFEKALKEAVMRHVKITLVTNSQSSTDSGLVGIISGKEMRRTAKLGIEVWEKITPGTIHGKTIVADGKTAYVGTYNLDYRSQHLNMESGMIVTDPDFSAELVGQITQNLPSHKRITHDASPDRHRCNARLLKTLLAEALKREL
jgi:putative cardiolipin synthase